MRSFSCGGMRRAAGLILCLMLTAAARAESRAASRPDSFDQPVRKLVVDLGKSARTGMRARLTCYYYATFAVKELDLGEEGAEWFAIVPERAQHIPACTQRHGPTEQVIAGKDWCGYFQGAKQGFIFLSACDAFNGGMEFAVYDAKTGKNIFQDTAVDADSGGLGFARAPDGALLIRYLRVVPFDCTVRTEEAACWSRIQTSLGLKSDSPPACDANEGRAGGTVIVYPVEVALTPAPAIRAATGTVRCHPAE